MIKITPEAKAWLEKKGQDTVTLIKRVARTSACSCSHLNYMDISFGVPEKNAEEFRKESIDGINVYYQSKLQIPDDREVSIQLESTLGLKSLKVAGLFDTGFMNV